jgi:hypothetical protein
MPFPILADVEFFQSRQRIPAWAERGNAHAKALPTPGEQAAHSLLVIVRSKQRPGWMAQPGSAAIRWSSCAKWRFR